MSKIDSFKWPDCRENLQSGYVFCDGETGYDLKLEHYYSGPNELMFLFVDKFGNSIIIPESEAEIRIGRPTKTIELNIFRDSRDGKYYGSQNKDFLPIFIKKVEIEV